MVEAEQVQDGRVQVVDVDLVLDGVVAELVGRAVDDAALEAAAGHPHREAERVVIAADSCRHRPGRIGVRPNSPPQTTSVSFEQTRALSGP